MLPWTIDAEKWARQKWTQKRGKGEVDTGKWAREKSIEEN